VALAARVEAGVSALDVGCGSGEFCQLAAARDARVSGIGAAAGLIEFATRKLPHADLRVGPIEHLPWPDDTFDVVSGFNAFQFAPDFVAARPCRGPGGDPARRPGRDLQLGVEDREVHAIFDPLSILKPRKGASPPVGEP
jgi:SAM-dependent methyltransferase